MRLALLAALLVITAASTQLARAAGAPRETDFQRQLADAVSADEAKSKTAIESLRLNGPQSLDALMRYPVQTTAGGNTPAELEALKRKAAAVDAVACQRDASTSGLFWYTDLEQAKAIAKATNKPIISLRLLGNLTDELSCANSRFFRTVLYANKEVSKELRENYVLHWSSERPVPKITIDFGDGRKIERTVTGNSVHYVLDSNGRLVDALPGLYGPRAFLAQLAATRAVVQQVNSQDDAEFVAMVKTYHARSIAAIGVAWSRDMASVSLASANVPGTGSGSSLAPKTSSSKASAPQRAAPAAPPPAPVAVVPNAADGMRPTASKAAFERPMIRGFLPEQMTQLDDSLDDKTWGAIAAMHADDAKLDAASIQLIRAKNPDAFSAAKITDSKRKVEDPLVRVTRQFQQAVAVDTVKNEYVLHRKIHEWFAASEKPLAFAPLNDRVYAELFLTPRSDPWLGLVPADTYTALQNDGLVTTAAR